MSVLNRVGTLIVAALAAGALTACWNPFEDPLKKYVNEHFPPVTETDQRTKAIDSGAKALAALTSPNLALSAQFADIQKLLKTDNLKAQGVTDLRVDGKEQMVRIRVSLARKFTESDGGSDETIKKLLATLQPDIEAKFEAYAGVTSALATDGTAGPTLTFKLLPAISNIEVTKVTVAGKYDVTSAGEVLVRLISGVKDNMAGELARNPITTMVIPAMSATSMDIKQLISSNKDGMKLEVEVQGNTVSVPFKLDGVALLVDGERLTSLAQVTPVATPPAAPSTVSSDFSSVRDHFNSMLDKNFKLPNATKGNWVAVRKDFIALALNTVSAQAAPCVTVSASTPNEHTSTKISIPKGSSLNCDPTTKCDPPDQCSFDASHDTRDCSTCLIPSQICAFGRCIGNGCAVRGNDPICEVAKAAQNLYYNTEANTRKAACDTGNAGKVAICQAGVAAKVALCQTAKVALDGIALTGSDFANFDTDSSAITNGMKVCLSNFVMAPDLSKVALTLNVSGDAQAKVNVHFDPLNVVGHIVCQFTWSNEQTFTAQLSQTLPISAGMTFATDSAGSPILNVSLDSVDVKARLSPGPTEYLLKSPQLLASCPIVAGFAPLVVAATPFVPQLRGDINYKTAASTLNVKIPTPTQTIGTSTLTVAVQSLPLAIQGVGTLADTAKLGSSK